ncbi:MAG TPA: Ig-like domain-containing protein, partial [Candidatus Kapabacteria bacterium]|nr:Ig-like domain-containing protein [Candidatus Kapabacteria bacterium]
MRIFLLLPLLAVLLAGCDNDPQRVREPAAFSGSAGLLYTYPFNGQTRIAPTAPVVLQFATTLSVTGGTLAGAFRFESAAGQPVPFTLSTTNNGRGVYLLPNAPLAENTEYRVSWVGLKGSDGPLATVPLSFTTRAANTGADSQTRSNTTFQVERSLPVQSNFPFMDFSTIRLQFTQPVESRTAAYGTSVRLEDAGGNLVPARLLLSRHLMSIDPVNLLTPGQTYTLRLTSAIESTHGQVLVPGAYAALNLTPANSAPRETLVMQVPSTPVASPLTGKTINNVPITSRLLGNDSASQQGGNLYTELAFVPNYPTATPLRVPRGNLLTGTAVDVQIVGRVPAGLNTGDISVNIVSDANGYMTENPYSTAVDAPRIVYLTMDAAMSSTTPSANGAFNQNLMHIDVVGMAIVKEGRLVIDAVGVAELEVLGLDQAAGVLSLHLEGYADQTTAPAQPVDVTPPALQSWAPGDEDNRARPGDPIILTFTEPLDPNSLTTDSIVLNRNGVAQPIDLRMDGSSIVIRPQQALTHNADYNVLVGPEVTDIAGNATTPLSLDFRLPDLVGPASRSPLVLAGYPGYPCVTSGRNATANEQGRCLDGKGTDDILPIPQMPADRIIQVQFSQDINPASVVLGAACGSGTFRVEQVSSGGTCLGTVAGRLEKGSSSLRFVPDQPWVAGQYYRYMLMSNGNSQSSTINCNGTQGICGSNNLPLQTQTLAQTPSAAPTATGGGLPMEIWFRGTAASTTVYQRLRALPATDVNVNFLHDTPDEIGAVDTG